MSNKCGLVFCTADAIASGSDGISCGDIDELSAFGVVRLEEDAIFILVGGKFERKVIIVGPSMERFGWVIHCCVVLSVEFSGVVQALPLVVGIAVAIA